MLRAFARLHFLAALAIAAASCSVEPSFDTGSAASTADAASSASTTTAAGSTTSSPSSTSGPTTTGSGGSGSGSGETGGGGASSTATSSISNGGGGAGGGSSTQCGDGLLEGDETCDVDSALCVGCGVACPSGWQLAPSGTRCFQPATSVAGFFDAASSCARTHASGVRARLATPRTQEDLDAVVSLCDDVGCFVGASDLGTEGVFAWIDGSAVDPDAFWAPGQPDDLDGRQDCLGVIAPQGRGELDDAPCDAAFSSVCEIVPGWAEDDVCDDDALDPGEECRLGEPYCVGCDRDCNDDQSNGEWKESPLESHLCYRTTDAQGSFDAGQTFCSDQGGRLATPGELGELEVTRYVCDTDGTTKACWLGASDVQDEGEFRWISGEQVPYQAGSPPWQPGEPNGGTSENCVIAGAATLNDVDCGSTRRPVCERAY